MTTIHIKATRDTENKILDELMNLLVKYGFKTETYLVMSGKIIMGKKEVEK